MLVDLSEIIKDIDAKVVLDRDIPFEPIEFMGECFTFEKPLHISGAVTNNSKSLEMKAEVSGEMGTNCARCRESITAEVNFAIDEVIMQSDGEISENEDVIVIDGEEIDIDEIILNNFLMNVSGKYLCGEDCKGLCTKCGANLNKGTCSCSTDEIDPRWAKLAEIMNNSSDTNKKE